MNFLFATNSSLSTHLAASQTQACSIATAPVAASSNPHLTLASTQQDIELVIEIESSFHGVLLGLPEESIGAVLNATAILHVRKKPIRASKLTATFDGRIKVQCSDGATFGSEQYRERVLAHKDWVLWEAGGNNTHSTTSTSASKNHIPVGTHYYPLSIQLDGALPPTFSGKHGSIRYILSSTLLRPIFYSDINAVQEIEIKRCLVTESLEVYGASAQHPAHLDLGSLLLNQLSRAGISGAINDSSEVLDTNTTDLPMGPTTITHHNTHKELLRYTASSPPIAHLEGGLIQVDLALEPLPPGSYIYSIAYGLKELIHYRSSATGNLADIKSEILYPIGQQTVIIPRDQERERSMSSAGAGASTRQLLELRPCPLLTNVDIVTPLIEIQHRITCNIAIVLADPLRRRNTLNGNARDGHQTDKNTSVPSGGGILRRLNLAPQPLAPSLNLIDSTGAEVANNAVLLGEPTLSIIEPALTPATVELNDAPPPPSSSQIESTLLEFPIILTSRYPAPSRSQTTTAHPTLVPQDRDHGAQGTGNEADIAHHAPCINSYSSSSLASSRPRQPINATEHHPTVPVFQQFVHNQQIAPTIIPTTGTTILATGPVIEPMLSRSVSSASSSSLSSTVMAHDLAESSSSSQSSPSASTPNTPPHAGRCDPVTLDAPTSSNSVGDGSTRTPARSGISVALRAAAAAAAEIDPYSESASSGDQVGQSRPPSYGRQGARPAHEGNPSADELPKYEDVVNRADRPDAGLGITMPQSTPVPLPMQVPYRGGQTVSPRSLGISHSPMSYQGMNSLPRGRDFASSPVSSPTTPSTVSAYVYDRGTLGSSPPMVRGHTRTGSATSMLLSTSLARSPGQSMSTLLAMTMTPSQSSPLQQQFTASCIQRQASFSHQRQQSQHQRQRSVGGAATIIGSLGRNGGYLSQQPVHLTMADCIAPLTVSVSGRHASPPAYVE